METRSSLGQKLYVMVRTFHALVSTLTFLVQENTKINRLYRVGVKDNIVTRIDTPTTCASKALIDYKSPFEAEVLTKLRNNGRFELVGKTKMDEFGMGSHSSFSSWGPTTRSSSFLQDYSPGGSSGGSAVAVADNHCDLGIGTDTGGSIRLPAAFTGIVGFKPSYGLISRWGLIPYANSMDTIGFLTRSVADSEEAFSQTNGHDPRDPTSLSIRDREQIFCDNNDEILFWKSHLFKESEKQNSSKWLKNITIGFPLEYNVTGMDPGILSTWKSTLRLLRSSGAKVVPVSLPNTKHGLPAYYILAPAEASSNLAKFDGIRYGTTENKSSNSTETLFAAARGVNLGPEVRRRIILGSFSLSSNKINNYFIQAQKVRRLVQQDFDRIFKAQNPLREVEQYDMSLLHESIPITSRKGPDKVDFLVAPTSPNYPPKLSEISVDNPINTYLNDIFTVPASLACLPSISVPIKAKDSDLFATGIQIIGQYGSDYGVLRLGHDLEQIYRIHENNGSTND
ncbi:hypothetical protein BGHDH14_bgh01190 [Blumeria hordei DH14]|uniref:Glutamyl-tRNA(Gln) amidotransferase subunit A, mitochondrial n=1 Tax=Blumeria graminis f. sp. hordei (strain DH14) TaxID=546991 RepID=N1J806_BLUG1|nr:hypothetical protein BGHDH14_bgh01190 [Blumeria hordei DH14]